jgi:hypothetical protein
MGYQDGSLSVNLLLNRASPWADVYSFIPYRGKVQMRIKTDCAALRVHAPAWVGEGSAELQAEVDGTPLVVRWDGRWLSLGAVRRGQMVSLIFPITERSESALMSGKTYQLLLRGDTVVAVDPPGKLGALYQREHYRQSEPPWRDVMRFVSDEDIDY